MTSDRKGKILISRVNNIIVFFTLSLLFSCSAKKKNDTSVMVKGSDTGLPISQMMAEMYMYKYPKLAITVVGGGSGVGISALRSGITDIAISSRGLKVAEKIIFKEKKMDIQKVVIGLDALAVIVHPNNSISKLTREQVENIFTGKVTNWKEVGGKDERIIVISRESSSGTFEFFKEHVMQKKNFSEKAMMLSATGGIIQSVSQNANAVAYVGIAYTNPEIKTLAISYDSGKTYIEPSYQNAKDGTYPISRPLYFFYDKKKYPKLKSFLDYTVSDEGQENVKKVGYIPIN